MKNSYLFLVLCSAMASAQVINFPDSNFKSLLVNSTIANSVAYNLSGEPFAVDANNDGEIQSSEAAEIGGLSIINTNVTSLEGINYFPNLIGIHAAGNNIPTLDIDGLANFQNADISQNQMSSLSLENLPSLDIVYADTNQLTSATFANCPAVTKIQLGANLLTSLDVSGLSALTVLNVGHNLLTSLNLTGTTSLQNLQISYGNPIVNLDATPCSSLLFFTADYSQVVNANFNGCAQLKTITATYSSLTSLDVTGCTSLTDMEFTFSQIASLNIHDLPSLTVLNASMSPITSITVANCAILNGIIATNSGLTTLTIHNCALLEGISVNDSPFSSLTIDDCPQFQSISAMNCALTSLDLSGFTSLQTLYLMQNPLTSLNLTNCSALTTLMVLDNQLTTLDLSTCTSLQTAFLAGNPLMSIYAKNGQDEDLNFDDSISSSAFICADESQLAAIQNTLNTNNISGVVVNSYCSFTPGGNFNTITGNVHFDADNNGCSASDPVLPYFKLKLNDGTTDSASLTNNAGAYSFYTGAGSYTIAPDFENASFFTVSPSSAATSFADNNTNSFAQDFCLAANGVHPDLEVTLVPLVPASPGFDAWYEIVYKNKGNQPLTGVLNFTFDDSVLDYVNASVIPDAQSIGALSFNYADLLPFEVRTIDIDLNVNGPTATPAVNNGDILAFTAASSITADGSPADNTFTLNQVVVGAFDPNDKTCLEGEAVSTTEIGNYLHYVIHFQNTGTAAAQNVVVSDIIDTTKFDISTLQLVNTSHPAQIRVTGNKAEFIFEGIQLAEQEHGEVVFKIKTLPTLPEGTTVTNQADIYFDYNFPVETNTASTAFTTLSAHDFGSNAGIKIYPNPAVDRLNIAAGSIINTITLYDIQGRLIAVSLPVSLLASVDVSTLQPGVYFVKVKTGDGICTKKIEKK